MANEIQLPTFRDAAYAGPKLYTLAMDRIMKTYCVVESELRYISLLNTLAEFFFGAGSFLLGVAISVALTGVQLDDGDLKDILFFWIAPVCGVMGIVGYLAGLISLWLRHGEWKAIQTSSVTQAKLTPVDESAMSPSNVGKAKPSNP